MSLTVIGDGKASQERCELKERYCIVKKQICALLAAVLLVGTLAGCGTKNPAESGNGNGSSAKSDVVFALSSEPATLTAYNTDEFTSFTIQYQLYNRLIEQTASGEFVPSLAESWEYNDAGDEITFQLRKGVMFHNGQELKATDVEYSYNAAIASSKTQNVTSMMDRMEATGDYTCKLILKQPFGPIESCLVYGPLSIMNRELCEANPDAFGRSPVGTGPYKFVRWDMGDKIVFEAFEDYWQGEASIKDLTFKITLDTSAALVAIENGEVDFCDTIPNSQKATVADNPDVAYASIGAPSTYYLQFNTSVEPFNDVNVRRAIASAIDPEAIVIGACSGLGIVNRTQMSNSVVGFPADWDTQYDYDVDKAKEYLAKSAYPDGFTVEMACMDDARYVSISEMVVEQCRQIGIDMTLEKFERSAYLEDVRARHNYSITVMASTPIYADADYLYSMCHSEYADGGRNAGEIRDPQLDALLEQGRATADPAERDVIYRNIVELMDQEMYVGGILQMDQSYFYNADLKGVIPSASRRCFVYDWNW